MAHCCEGSYRGGFVTSAALVRAITRMNHVGAMRRKRTILGSVLCHYLKQKQYAEALGFALRNKAVLREQPRYGDSIAQDALYALAGKESWPEWELPRDQLVATAVIHNLTRFVLFDMGANPYLLHPIEPPTQLDTSMMVALRVALLKDRHEVAHELILASPEAAMRNACPIEILLQKLGSTLGDLRDLGLLDKLLDPAIPAFPWLANLDDPAFFQKPIHFPYREILQRHFFDVRSGILLNNLPLPTVLAHLLISFLQPQSFLQLQR
jgi:hypothetical protein